jgi:NAD(P)H-quinone oxidoreductase subunit 5
MTSIEALMLIGIGTPAALLVLLASASVLNRPLWEQWTGRLAAVAMTISFAAIMSALLLYLATGTGEMLVSYGYWSTAHEGGIAIEFLLDGMSLAFAALAAAIAGIVSAFSNRYLHREAGYNRYFVLFAMFVTGILLVALAGNVEVLFAGWELVGLSSALLVAFFHDRPAPVGNALRVFSVYRISDAAMLSAAVLLHHVAGSGSLSLLFGRAASGGTGLSMTSATTIALLLVVAAAGKSALLPFSGWLPRAMEGPTPSSAVYYGSLSIHAGCFLLLRAAPLLEQSTPARLLAGGLGLATALFSALVTRVQSDVKSSLAYAALTQVGIIVVEIALGLYTIAFFHLAGHACFRLLQFLSAPNVLHDLHGLESAAGEHHDAPALARIETMIPAPAQQVLFLFALERGFLDATLDRAIVEPFHRVTSWMARLDGFLCDFVIRRTPSIFVETGDERDE